MMPTIVIAHNTIQYLYENTERNVVQLRDGSGFFMNSILSLNFKKSKKLGVRNLIKYHKYKNTIKLIATNSSGTYTENRLAPQNLQLHFDYVLPSSHLMKIRLYFPR